MRPLYLLPCVAALLVSAACHDDARTTIIATRVDKAPQQAHERHFVPYAVDSAPTRVPVNKPLWITANEAGAVVTEQSTGNLVAVDAHGKTRWTRSVRPLGNVRDTHLGEDGRLLVLAGAKQVVISYNDKGEPVDTVSVSSAGHVEQAMPAANGAILAVVIDSARPFAIVDRHGAVVRRYEIPWASYRELPPLARFGHAHARADGGWTFAFGAGDRWMTFDPQGKLKTMAGYVEEVPFPNVIEVSAGKSSGARLARHLDAALGVQQIGDTVAVLFGGARSTSGKFIDLYDAPTGRYLGSWTLAIPASGFAVTRTRLYTLSTARGGEVAMYRRTPTRVASR